MLTTSHNTELRKVYKFMVMFSPYHTLQKQEISVFGWWLLMLEIDILFNLFMKGCMFITSITKNFEGCSAAKFDSNWDTH